MGAQGGRTRDVSIFEGVVLAFLFCFLQGGKVVGFWRDLQHEDPSRGC